MKKLIIITAIICGLAVLQTANAQNPITTLEHAGSTTVFYGKNSLVDAYNASANGDALYLSTGYFTQPSAIAKGIKIIGAGHFPDSANVARRTTILSGISINKGADSLRLEGLYINGDINYQSDASINYVKVIRCRLGSALFNSNSATASKNYCSYEECFINGGVNFSNYGNNFLIVKSIIYGRMYLNAFSYATISNINGSGLLEGNIILGNEPNWNYSLAFIYSSLIQNNIIINSAFLNVNSNFFNNNVFVSSSVDFGTNSYSNNYTNIAQANIFVNQTGNAIDYTHDYHLKNPEKYLGTDGTQVGLYGGTTPFKEKGAPSNPQIIKKIIGSETDIDGNLNVNITVKAQDR